MSKFIIAYDGSFNYFLLNVDFIVKLELCSCEIKEHHLYKCIYNFCGKYAEAYIEKEDFEILRGVRNDIQEVLKKK